MKNILHFSILILLLNSCFLFSPKPKSETHFWGEYIPIHSYAGFINNFDSNEFLESAINPSALMRENYVRQGRPLYVVVASFVGYSIYYASTIFKDIYSLSLNKSMYIAYVFLNFTILLSALYLFKRVVQKITNEKISHSVVLMLSVFIASNLITKAFFWTAHQQMFAFLIPLLSLHISMVIIQGQSKKMLYAGCFLLGLGMLVYGSFLIVFVVNILYLAFLYYKSKRLWTVQATSFFVLASILFVMPTLIWIVFLKMNGIVYYNHEIERYRQIVWMLDALMVSPIELFTTVCNNIVLFVSTVYELFLFAGLFVFVFVYNSNRIRAVAATQNFKLILLNLVCFVVFFMFLGYYANRLTFTLMPLILCLSVANLGCLLDSYKNKILLFVLVCMWHAYNVCSYGPFS